MFELTVSDLYVYLQILSVDAEKMRVVLEKYYYNNELRLLTVPNKTLKSEGFLRSNKVKNRMKNRTLNA